MPTFIVNAERSVGDWPPFIALKQSHTGLTTVGTATLVPQVVGAFFQHSSPGRKNYLLDCQKTQLYQLYKKMLTTLNIQPGFASKII